MTFFVLVPKPPRLLSQFSVVDHPITFVSLALHENFPLIKFETADFIHNLHSQYEVFPLLSKIILKLQKVTHVGFFCFRFL